MARFVFRHLVDGVVDRVEIELLCQRRQILLALACAMLRRNACFEILFRRCRQHFAEQLRKFRRVLCLFQRITTKRLAYLRISLSMRRSAHRKVHADLTAFAVEIRAQALKNLLVDALRHAYHVLVRKHQFAFLLLEFVGIRFADRALNRRLVSFMHITAYTANPFCHNKKPPKT